jgi:hypothetical protein
LDRSFIAEYLLAADYRAQTLQRHDAVIARGEATPDTREHGPNRCRATPEPRMTVRDDAHQVRRRETDTPVKRNASA